MNQVEDQKRLEAAGEPRVWIVVVTKPQQERIAKVRLEQQGFEVYLPMKLSTNRRHELVASPFFPKYLFARVTLAVDRWKSIYSTIGVCGVLGRGETPTGVRDDVVQRIRDQEDAGFIRMGLEEDLVHLGLGAGTRVSVDGGCLEGLFLERVDAKRAVILVSLLGRDSRHTVDLRRLKAAGS